LFRRKVQARKGTIQEKQRAFFERVRRDKFLEEEDKRPSWLSPVPTPHITGISLDILSLRSDGWFSDQHGQVNGEEIGKSAKENSEKTRSVDQEESNAK